VDSARGLCCRLAATGGSLKAASAYIVSVIITAPIIAWRASGRNPLPGWSSTVRGGCAI